MEYPKKSRILVTFQVDEGTKQQYQIEGELTEEALAKDPDGCRSGLYEHMARRCEQALPESFRQFWKQHNPFPTVKEATGDGR